MPKEWEDIEKHVSKVVGSVQTVQLDIMDGIFVPPSTWPFYDNTEKYWNMLKKHRIQLPEMDHINYELDLMVDTPEDEIFDWVNIEPHRIIFHVESIKDTYRFRQEIDRIPPSIEIGFAIGNNTPLNTLEPYLVFADFIQIMGIEKIGYQGQSFDERCLSRAQFLKEEHPDLPISVDGAVSVETILRLYEVGVDRFVSGSQVFGAIDPRDVIGELKQLIKSSESVT